jgi:pectin methylesterase-like acyl-CoA thioesterase
VTRLNANNITTSTWATTRKVIVQVRATKFISSNAIKDLIYQDPVVVAKRTLARFEPFRSGWDGAQIGRPLSGKFVIQCATKTGVSAITAPIAVSASSASIKAAIILVCTDLAYDITVTEGGSFSGIVLNGRDIIIKLTPAIDFLQFNISTSSIDPIIAG